MYFLIREREIVYVGKAQQTAARLLAHWRSGREFDAYFALQVSERWNKEVESFYIEILDPPQNIDRPDCYYMLRLARQAGVIA